MGQSRRDREWPVPRNTRFAYLLAEDTLNPPAQALVIAWRRHAYKWTALIIRIDESVPGGRLIQEWVTAERLRPVRADPNKVIRYSNFSELLRPSASKQDIS